MKHTTATDTEAAALLAEVDALLAEADATDARIEVLLAQGSPAVVMADLAIQLEQGRRELDAQERYQRRISRAMEGG